MRNARPLLLVLLLTISVLSARGIPQVQNQNGSIAGTVRASTGGPAAGVRVAALSRPDAIQDLTSLSSFAGLAETDSAGRYRLENIPPGRYYIVAGRVDTPTFYPGTVQITDGTLITVAATQMISGIDFTLNNVSVGRADAAFGGSPSWIVPIQVRIEGDNRIPLFVDGKFPTLRFTRAGTASLDVALNSPNVLLPFPDYGVSVENLSGGYVLKSLVFDSTDLQSNPLLLPAANNRVTVPVAQNLVLTLTRLPMVAAPGVRVAGRFREDGKRSIYISGKPGAIYSDRSWEFYGVSPGRYTLATLDNPRPDRALGATLVVGDQDLLNVDLGEITVVPAGSSQPTSPAPAGNRRPGSRIPPSAIHGHIVDAETREPLTAGKVIVNGNYAAMFALNDDGSFEIPNLLSGRYELEAIVYGIGTSQRTVEVDETDVTIELALKP